jgi:hypothetical protein
MRKSSWIPSIVPRGDITTSTWWSTIWGGSAGSGARRITRRPILNGRHGPARRPVWQPRRHLRVQHGGRLVARRVGRCRGRAAPALRSAAARRAVRAAGHRRSTRCRRPLAARAAAAPGVTVTCARCEDCGWVCENLLDTPWDGEHACKCDGAGCPARSATRATWKTRCPARQPARGSSSIRTAGAISAPKWSREFEDPIILPEGHVLSDTSRRGQLHLGAKPERKEGSRMAQCRRSAIAGGGERRSDDVCADWRHEGAQSTREREFNPSRKDTHWGKRKLKRDE